MHHRREYEVCTTAPWLLGCTAVCKLTCFSVCWLQHISVTIFCFFFCLLSFLTQLQRRTVYFTLWQWPSLCCHKQVANCSIKSLEGPGCGPDIYSRLTHDSSTQRRCAAPPCTNTHFSTRYSHCSSNPFPLVIIQRHCQNTARAYITSEPVKRSPQGVKCAPQCSRCW